MLLFEENVIFLIFDGNVLLKQKALKSFQLLKLNILLTTQSVMPIQTS